MAKKEEAKAPAADADGKPAGKSKLKLIILIVVGLLLAIGLSVGATLFFLKGDKKEEAKSEEHAKTEDAGKPVKKQAIYEVLAPAFVVNYNFKGRQRYMQVSVALMGRDKAEMDALHEHMPVLRNNLVMLFSGQDFEALSTPVGKEMLRQQTTASVQALAQKETGKMAVEQVLFTNIVLQ
ncbi:MAG: flagellar basal body-associated protein FliL [Pseudomonadales bacterium]|jgi:flagellar FliL protein|nr:flagellar basal body-associated protein FliL [Pseudomonadales bacterium]